MPFQGPGAVLKSESICTQCTYDHTSGPWASWPTLLTFGYGSIPISTSFSGMNIHLPAILGVTRYKGFDLSPFRKKTVAIQVRSHQREISRSKQDAVDEDRQQGGGGWFQGGDGFLCKAADFQLVQWREDFENPHKSRDLPSSEPIEPSNGPHFGALRKLAQAHCYAYI